MNKGHKSPKKKGKDKKKFKKPDWVSIPPSEGQPMTKTVNNKSYHWCSRHKAWTRHMPADCHGCNVPTSTNQEGSTMSTPNSNSNTDTERKLKLQQSLATITEDNDESL